MGKGTLGEKWNTKREDEEENNRNIRSEDNKKGRERSVRREMKGKGRGKEKKRENGAENSKENTGNIQRK